MRSMSGASTILSVADDLDDMHFVVRDNYLEAQLQKIDQTKDVALAVAVLEQLARFDDNEEAHIRADKILHCFVPGPVSTAWDKIHKWYA